MSVDITKCIDHECPWKDSCYRWLAVSNPHRQSVFLASPRRDNHCVMYWGVDQEAVYNNLAEVMR